jgi:hypothetical protein
MGGCSISIGDTSYYIGGYVSSDSDPTAGSLPHSGIYQTTVTSFDSSSGIWEGAALQVFDKSGASYGARAVTIPAFSLDERGLIFILGGWDPEEAVTSPSYPRGNYTGFDNITFYDPYIDRWYSQKVTGDIPAYRESFCAVSAKGDNGTYKMQVRRIFGLTIG